ncbi:TetR/AcrR family transcriptional regulator [Robiginitalea sp. M366]|uniref:TetR/AcrR family transcriptional regulator n=1 Tax=Robiginitalea aestuariiviva TaxID=3036903 RepID=UPI00240D50B6|nr:TetR/AcrR family transcriptional regulator [Robiginitalea aestuariiviva]MDG1571295.1 TetR/AcrR family transcriptional regulator [Robiginitalea aestuariiviva]
MKTQILDTATELFLNLGFKSVTMDDLSEHMGISKKTIYAHFKNKTDLVDQCTMGLFHKISHGIDCICDLGKNPIEELYEIKKFAMLHLKNEKTSPQYQLRKYYPAIFQRLQQKQFDVMQQCVVRNIRRGMEMGIYRANLNVDFVARIYFTGVTSLKDETLFPKNLLSQTELMDMYLEYHLRGIVTPKGRNVLNNIINSNCE